MFISHWWSCTSGDRVGRLPNTRSVVRFLAHSEHSTVAKQVEGKGTTQTSTHCLTDRWVWWISKQCWESAFSVKRIKCHLTTIAAELNVGGGLCQPSSSIVNVYQCVTLLAVNMLQAYFLYIYQINFYLYSTFKNWPKCSHTVCAE